MLDVQPGDNSVIYTLGVGFPDDGGFLTCRQLR